MAELGPANEPVVDAYSAHTRRVGVHSGAAPVLVVRPVPRGRRWPRSRGRWWRLSHYQRFLDDIGVTGSWNRVRRDSWNELRAQHRRNAGV
jgi:hypothetical protein